MVSRNKINNYINIGNTQQYLTKGMELFVKVFLKITFDILKFELMKLI